MIHAGNSFCEQVGDNSTSHMIDSFLCHAVNINLKSVSICWYGERHLTILTSFNNVTVPTRGNWFQTNPLDHESDEGGPSVSV